jgi:hypothetical protein
MQKVVWGVVFAVCYPLAILFAKQIGFWFVVILSELLMISIVADLLYRNVPVSLLNASRDNCFRVDGSLSRHRKWLERQASFRVYTNLITVIALVAMAGNLLVLWIDASILPLPLASETLSLFTPDLHAWRDRIADANLDTDYSNWRYSGDAVSEMTDNPNFVKITFPAILGIASLWLVGSIILILKTYRFSLAQFELGIRNRNKEYVDRDIGRFQSHEDFLSGMQRDDDYAGKS